MEVLIFLTPLILIILFANLFVGSFTIEIIKQAFGSSDPSTNNADQNNSDSSRYFFPIGEYESGFYLEEINVFIKGPVYRYSFVNDKYFLGYAEGKLSIKNSSGILEIKLNKINDNRIVPTNVWLNGDKLLVIDKNGDFISSPSYNSEISIARTLNYILGEQVNRNFDESIRDVTFELLEGLLVFNMMVKRKIILNHNSHELEIKTEYISNLDVHINTIEEKAKNLFDKYFETYIDNNDKKIEELLSILELPANTRDINLIKKQYRLLSKKYHPDVNNQSDKKFKEINYAYNELCVHVQAS